MVLFLCFYKEVACVCVCVCVCVYVCVCSGEAFTHRCLETPFFLFMTGSSNSCCRPLTGAFSFFNHDESEGVGVEQRVFVLKVVLFVLKVVLFLFIYLFEKTKRSHFI